MPWAIAVIAVATTGAVLMSDRSNASRETRTVRFEIAPPGGGVFQPVGSLGVSAVIAPDGRTLALVVNTEGRRQLFVRSLDSTVLRALPGTEGAANPFWSPDSRWIGFFADAKLKKVEITGGSPLSICSLYDRRTGTPDLWLFDLARRVSTRFTSEPGMEWMPVWSPDATRIAFSADEDSPPYPHVKKIGGEARIERLVESGNFPQMIWDWTRTAAGEFILYGNIFAETSTDLVVLPLSGDRKPRPFAPAPLDQIDARFSPDGKWVAYVSNESGRHEIYICAFADPGERQRVSTAGGSNPRWTRGGKELVYRGGDGRLMAVSVTDTGSAKLGIDLTTPLFALGARDDGYEVSQDGTRFLVHRNEGPSSLVNVVLNGLPNPRP